MINAVIFTITVIANNGRTIVTVNNSHTQWEEIVKAIDEHDEDYLIHLLSKPVPPASFKTPPTKCTCECEYECGCKTEDDAEAKDCAPRNELEQIAQDAGILDPQGGSPATTTQDNFEDEYLQGMKHGIEDKMKIRRPIYIQGDEHSAYIEGYVDGYA